MEYGSLLANLLIRPRPELFIARNQRDLKKRQKCVLLATVQGVSVTNYDAARHGDLYSSQDVSFERIAPYLFVVRNETGRSITALTMRWCWIRRRGDRIHEGSLGTDGYFPRNSRIEPGAELVVGPQRLGFLPAARTGEIRFNVNGPGMVERFEESSRVSLNTDAVIYENGEVVGPDNSRTAQEIRKRALAIEEILRRLYTGASIEELLNERVTQRYAPSDPIPQILRTLQNFQDGSEVRTALLQARRTIPAFHKAGLPKKRLLFESGGRVS